MLACVLTGCASTTPQQAPAPVEDPTTSAPSSTTTEPLLSDSLERRVREATIRIRNDQCDGLGVGSGFLVADGLALTNSHVVNGNARLSASTWDGRDLSVGRSMAATDADVGVV